MQHLKSTHFAKSIGLGFAAVVCAGWASTAYAGASCYSDDGALGGVNDSGAAFATCSLTGVATADLAGGTLRASKLPAWYGTAEADFSDRLTLSGFADDAIYSVGFSESVHGAYSLAGQWRSLLRATNPWTGAGSSADVQASQSFYVPQTSGAAVINLLSLAPDDISYVMTVYVPVSRKTPTIDFSSSLSVLDYAPAFIDFSNTSRVSLILPAGLTFTSASGVFLTQAGVPEVGTWIMMIAGLGLTGAALRRARWLATPA